MFRKNMLLGFLMSWLSSFGQRQDSTGARKKALSQTDIDIVYAQYLQNGTTLP